MNLEPTSALAGAAAASSAIVVLATLLDARGVNAYTATCNRCTWQSEPTTSRREAKRAVLAHRCGTTPAPSAERSHSDAGTLT